MLSDHLQVIDFNKKLKSWYVRNHRPLLWRETTDPYRIWLSEIILQQTRVAQGTPYYEKFLLNFPTVVELAEADEKEVLRLWQGLGYYSRARNMHFTARQIVTEHGGEFPKTAAQLVKLKGLGKYTAAAIASFAFGEVVAAIDGNVYRVMARLFGIFTDILSIEGQKEFALLAKDLISEDDPGTFNQAMIEFGAIQCVPVNPDCSRCPFSNICYAYEFNIQARLPVKAKKAAVRNRYFNYFILRKGNMLAMRERRSKDIWRGLYDFCLLESKDPVTSPDELEDSGAIDGFLVRGQVRRLPKVYLHLLTHQRLHVRFWWIDLPENDEVVLPSDLKFYCREEIHMLPKPILVDTLLREEGYF